MSEEMSADPRSELARLMLQVSQDAPIGVLADCIEIMSTVLARRIDAEIGET